MTIQLHTMDEALHRARDLLAAATDRVVIGIIGKPGAGKSTLSSYLMEHLPSELVALVPMDGYHLSNSQLARLSRADRKGAPDTFDSHGFADLLGRINTDMENEIYFPVFHREIEESIAAEGVVSPRTRLVITEGNYLLLDQGGWTRVAHELTESWYVQVDDHLRLDRLVQRHHEYGKDIDSAYLWAHGTDEKNATLVEGTKIRADAIIRLNCL